VSTESSAALSPTLHQRLSGMRDRRYVHESGVYVALVLLGAGLTLVAPEFLTGRNLTNILLESAPIAIIAIAFTLVLIAGEIDLSIASVQALVGTVAAIFIIQSGMPTLVGIAAALGLGVLVGVVNGYFVVFGRIPSFVVTLAMLGTAQGVALLLTDAEAVAGFPDAYGTIGRGDVGPIPVPVLIAGVLGLLVHLLLTQTRFGVNVHAVGGGRRAAVLAGIRTGHVLLLCFALSGLLCGIAGIVLSSRLNAGSGTFGETALLLDAVAAVVIGGTSLTGGVGTVLGTVGGVLMISTIRNGLILLNVAQFWQEVLVGAIIVIAVLVDQIVKGLIKPADLVSRPD
jgi:ribose transport system permease protein